MVENCTPLNERLHAVSKAIDQVSAKNILRSIKNKAFTRRTYYVILDNWSGSHSVTWEQRLAAELGCTSKVWVEVVKLDRRYRRFCNYIQEVKPEWREVDRIHWADNSIESIQRDRFGNIRKVMVVPPHGDACEAGLLEQTWEDVIKCG